MLRAADELRREAFVSDRTWADAGEVLRHEAPDRDHLHERRLHDDRARDQQPRHPARTRLSVDSQTMKLNAAVLLAAALAFCSLAHAQQGMRKGEWHYWGGDAGSTRYSALDQINATNARNLRGRVALAIAAGRGRAGRELQGDAADDRWRAVHERRRPPGGRNRSGDRHDAVGVHARAARRSPVAAACRPAAAASLTGATAARSACSSTRSTGGCISIDASTGKADPKLRRERHGAAEGAADAIGPCRWSARRRRRSSSATSSSCRRFREVAAPNKEAVPGHIRGYDVRTGKRLWTFHTIPQRGRVRRRDLGEGFVAVHRQHRRVDHDERRPRARLRVPARGNADARFLRRPSARRQSVCREHRVPRREDRQARVALPDRASRRVGLRSAGRADSRATSRSNGRKITAVTLLTKQAMSFVFDRMTGKPVWPIEERPVPASDVPGERLSPTQPFPTKPAPYEKLGYHEEDLIDFTP